MMRFELLAASVAGSMLAGCAVQPATPHGIAIAAPSVQETGGVAIYSEVCDVPAPMRVVSEIEVYNDRRERPAINRDLAARAAKSGANAIVLHPNNRWALGAAYTSAEPNSFDSLRFSRATAVKVLHNRPMTTPALTDDPTGSVTCGAR